MQPEAMESGALNDNCQMKRKDSRRPREFGPYASLRYWYEPPALGMAAPSSAQTSPSHRASTAPTIQPSMAWGPPAALTIRGMVMNGPTPIMSIMFSVVALAKPMPRISSGCPTGLLWLMAHAQQIHVEANRSGDAER